MACTAASDRAAHIAAAFFPVQGGMLAPQGSGKLHLCPIIEYVSLLCYENNISVCPTTVLLCELYYKYFASSRQIHYRIQRAEGSKRQVLLTYFAFHMRRQNNISCPGQRRHQASRSKGPLTRPMCITQLPRYILSCPN